MERRLSGFLGSGEAMYIVEANVGVDKWVAIFKSECITECEWLAKSHRDVTGNAVRIVEDGKGKEEV